MKTKDDNAGIKIIIHNALTEVWILGNNSGRNGRNIPSDEKELKNWEKHLLEAIKLRYTPNTLIIQAKEEAVKEFANFLSDNRVMYGRPYFFDEWAKRYIKTLSPNKSDGGER